MEEGGCGFFDMIFAVLCVSSAIFVSCFVMFFLLRGVVGGIWLGKRPCILLTPEIYHTPYSASASQHSSLIRSLTCWVLQAKPNDSDSSSPSLTGAFSTTRRYGLRGLCQKAMLKGQSTSPEILCSIWLKLWWCHQLMTLDLMVRPALQNSRMNVPFQLWRSI